MILKKIFKHSGQTVEKPENTFQNKLLNDISPGETIEIDGKKFTKITIQIVDSMNYRVTDYVEKLENRIGILKEEILDIRNENTILHSQKDGQTNYISLLLNDIKVLQNRLEVKNDLIKSQANIIKSNFVLLRKKAKVMLQDKKDELEKTNRATSEIYANNKIKLEKKYHDLNQNLNEQFLQKKQSLEAKYKNAIASCSNNTVNHSAKVKYFLLPTTSLLSARDILFVNYSNFVKSTNRYKVIKKEIPKVQPVASRNDLLRKHDENIAKLQDKYLKRLGRSDHLIRHLEGKIQTQREEIHQFKEMRTKSNKEIEHEKEKVHFMYKTKMEEIHKVNNNLVETIKKLRAKIENPDRRFTSID